MTAVHRISSRENPRIKSLSQLCRSGRERRRIGLAVLEGVHLCEAWCRQYGAPSETFVSDSGAQHPEVAALIERFGLTPILVSDAVFASISTLQQGVGLLCTVATPQPAMPECLDHDVVYLDGLQDSGNVGTILRTCAAAGVARVVTSPTTVWCWSPKVLRAGMGAHFVVTIHEAVPWDALASRVRVPVIGTRVRQATSLYEASLTQPVVWVLGNEGQGLSKDLQKRVDLWLAIPQVPGVESLNVAAAAAICLFEQRRQRLSSERGLALRFQVE